MKQFLKFFVIFFNLQFSIFYCSAQQIPALNQSLFNPYLINPAYAGANSFTQIFLNVRDQWREMPGAPFFSSITADGQLNNTYSGVGFQLQSDRQPLIQNITGMLTYRHLVKLNSDHSVRLGLSAGLIHNSINLSNINAASPTESVLMEKNNSKASFDVNAGLIYRFRKFEAGFAALQLNNAYFRYINSATGDGLSYRLIRCFNINASYRFDVGKNWNITPLAILYSTQGMPAYLLSSCKVEYLGDYWLAAGYRTDRSIAVSCGVLISEKLCLGYSFETPINKYGVQLGNTHELTLGIRLFGRSGAPANHRDVTRKEMEQLTDVVRMQSQQIDQLMEETGRLRDDAAKQQQRYDSQRVELEKLITQAAEQSATQREETERLKNESLTPAQLDNEPPSSPDTGNYAVIVGSYVNIEDAKLYQKILERELGVITRILTRQKGQVRFLVYSLTVQTQQEAQAEYDRLNKLGIEKYKQGTLWLYKFETTKNND